MWYDEEDFYEPSEFDMQIEELKNSLRKSVKQEILDKISQLEKDNAELTDIKENWEAKIRELENLKSELNIKISQAENEVKKARLYEIIKPFTETAWAVQYKYEYIHDKCEKCDKDGYIHYKSPRGRDQTEKCECREQKCIYYPVEAERFEISQFIPKHRKNSDVYLYFRYSRNKNCDGDETDQYTFCETSEIYQWQKYEDISVYDGIIFFDKEECQKFCDYLNNKKKQ